MRTEQNIHATCLIIGDRGVLVTGDSGSGKTSLALSLAARYGAAGIFTRLVADDRTVVIPRSHRLIGRAPAPISGLVEVYGLGPRRIDTEAAALIDLLVELVPGEAAPRFSEGETRVLSGCRLPLLVLAKGNVSGAMVAIAARLGLAPFARGDRST